MNQSIAYAIAEEYRNSTKSGLLAIDDMITDNEVGEALLYSCVPKDLITQIEALAARSPMPLFSPADKLYIDLQTDSAYAPLLSVPLCKPRLVPRELDAPYVRVKIHNDHPQHPALLEYYLAQKSYTASVAETAREITKICESVSSINTLVERYPALETFVPETYLEKVRKVPSSSSSRLRKRERLELSDAVKVNIARAKLST